MKRILTVVFTMLTAASLTFAQNTGDNSKSTKSADTGKATTTANTSGKKGHNGGKTTESSGHTDRAAKKKKKK